MDIVQSTAIGRRSVSTIPNGRRNSRRSPDLTVSPTPRPLWLDRDIQRDLLRLSIPTVISTLAVPLLGVVDTAVLGRLPEVTPLAGAAWASHVAPAAGWLAAMVIGWRRARAYWDWQWISRWRQLAWGHFFAVQSHLFVRTLVLVLTFAVVTALVARLQSAPLLAVHAILMQLWSLVSHAVDGLAYATETTVGSWLGRRDVARARASGVAALMWGVGASLIFAVVYLVGVEHIARFFTHDAEVRAIVSSLAWAIALSQPINAAAYVFDGILIGATDTRCLRNAMLLSIAVFVAGVALGWTRFGLSLPLVWTVLLLFMTMRAVTLGIRFQSGAWEGVRGQDGCDRIRRLVAGSTSYSPAEQDYEQLLLNALVQQSSPPFVTNWRTHYDHTFGKRCASANKPGITRWVDLVTCLVATSRRETKCRRTTN